MKAKRSSAPKSRNAKRIRRRSAPRTRTRAGLPDDGSWLFAATGKTRAEWLGTVQECIVATAPKRTVMVGGFRHGTCAPDAWMAELSKRVLRTAPRTGLYDGNMRHGAVMAAVLALWFARLTRAKSYDPRRPISGRRAALARRHQWVVGMLDVLAREDEDPKHFPGQHWDDPSSPHAIDGVFL